MDLRRLVDFLAEKNPRAANAAFDALSDALLSLQTLPERGRKAHDPEHRELHVNFGRDGYVVQYRVGADEVVVARIFHARERR